MKRSILLLVSLAAVLLFASVASADGPNALDVTVGVSPTITVIQNLTSPARKKTAYILAEEGTIRVRAVVWQTSAYVVVWPNPSEVFTDDWIKVPVGYSLPIEGTFHGVEMKSDLGDVAVQVQWY